MEPILVSNPDAVVVGTGLAGLTVAFHILSRGGSCLLLEKEARVGGNSAKASSGINSSVSVDDNDSACNNGSSDGLESFRRDTLRSAGIISASKDDEGEEESSATTTTTTTQELIDILCQQSEAAISFLQDTIGADLSELGQLGGHSVPRTHRPKTGAVGWELISKFQAKLQEAYPKERLQIVTACRVTKLLRDDPTGSISGVSYEIETKDDNNEVQMAEGTISCPTVVLCTGGFAADHSTGSLLAHHQPQFLKLPTTAGAFSTGDGIHLATALGADTVDLEKVQIHPTGFVDPKDPNNSSKFLAAELMRGIGGILVNDKGKRFCNELGRRDYVTDQMFAMASEEYRQTHKWNANQDPPIVTLLLSKQAETQGGKHTGFYKFKGLMEQVDGGLDGLAKWMGASKEALDKTLTEYQIAARDGMDEFGKTVFRNIPTPQDTTFFVAKVTPVVHYCMGGIKIDAGGRVLDSSKEANAIPGLYACGEVTGGVHGDNRLGGNSLLECTVFGSIVGKSVKISTTIAK